MPDTYVAPDYCDWANPECTSPPEKGSAYCRPHQLIARRDTLRTIIGRYFETVGVLTEEQRHTRAAEAMVLLDSLAGQPRPTRYVVASTEDQDFLPTWDGQLFDRPDDLVARVDLTRVRGKLAQTKQLLGDVLPDPGPESWGVFALVQVTDELVFPSVDEEADHA